VTPRERHVDARGAARMVDVGAKPESARMARARAVVALGPHAMGALSDGALAKGDAMAVARIAAIQAAKRTPDLVPLCHPLVIDHVAADVALDLALSTVTITTEVRAIARTGVEMEALAAASAGALAIYDMTKGEDGPAPVITEVRLLEKNVEPL
jgi:cyclic pyranopterin monophosphate synthase